MNRRLLSFVLAGCVVWADAGFVFGDDASPPSPVVFMGRSASFALPTEKSSLGGRVLREMVRQSFLAAARDGLGLRTRDESLGDEMSGGDANTAFAVSAMRENGVFLDVRRGAGASGKTLLHEKLEVVPSALEHVTADVSIVSVNYRAVLEEQEKLSRGKYVDVLKQAGFQGKPHTFKETAEVPEKIEGELRKLDFLSQYSAVRRLHELIRTDGESPERLGALVRGYANLGLLTEFYWHPAQKVFKARALVYAQRMVSSDKQASRALWHRAYAFTLAGMFRYAFEDLKAAEQKSKAAGKDAGQRPSWVDLIDAYCLYDHDRLHNAAKKGPKEDRKLAWLLWFDGVKHTHYKVMILRAAGETLHRCPDCYVAIDAVCEHGGVGTGHTATTAPFKIAGLTLYSRLLEVPGLPKAAADIAKKESTVEEDASDDEEPSIEEKPLAEEAQTRANLIRALLASDGKSAADSQDRGEPSMVCLGRLISNLSFVHVWRRARFLDVSLAVPTADFLKTVSPMVEMHPYYPYLATHTETPAEKRVAWEKFKIAQPDDLDFLEACMWLEYRERHMPETDGMRLRANRQHDDTHRDYYTFATNDPNRGDPKWWAFVLCRDNPHSPLGPALAVMFGGDDFKARMPEWEKLAEQQPSLAAAFAIRTMGTGDLKNAEKWLKIAAKSGDIEALKNLAAVYCEQGKMDDWIKTLQSAMESPDVGLFHAMFNTYIARYYMREGKWEEAFPFAQNAASSGAAWALQTLADYYEGTHDWANAEAVRKSIGERYSVEGMQCYGFCRRTGRGDIAAAERAGNEIFRGRISSNCDALVYYLDKDMGKAQVVLGVFTRDGNPIFLLFQSLLADESKDAAGRDKLLERVKGAGGFRSPFNNYQKFDGIAALAKLIADDLAKGGKGDIDLAAAEKLNPRQPYHEDASYGKRSAPNIAFDYLLGRYLDRHGKPDLAVRCWKRCVANTEYISDIHRTLACAELLSRHVQLDSEGTAEKKDSEKE